MTPFLGFTPDIDPTTPGAITNCTQLIPSLKGMKGAPTAIDGGLSALAAACRGSAYVTRLDAARRLFAGTQTSLYELSGSTWVDVTRYGPSTTVLTAGVYQSRTVADIVSEVRATTATYTDAAGVLQTAAINAPRIDYNPATLSLRGLLIEDAATNMLFYSEQLDNAAWSKFDATVTANATTAPDGTVTADKIVDNTNNVAHTANQTKAGGGATSFAASIYAKAAELPAFYMRCDDAGSTNVRSAQFDVQNGVVINSGVGTTGTITITSATIESVGNLWYRCICLFTFSAAPANVRVYIGLKNTTASFVSGYAGTGTSGLYFWGAQLETGVAATSYIQTTAAAVTRAADTCTVYVRQYAGGAENLWRFAQFGNVSLAANELDKIQYSASGAFADITQAPKARIIETAAGFVLAFAINDATVGGDRSDAWWCSNIYDYATWTPASSNQAAWGYLLDTPGEIRAGKRFGQDVIAYKERSMYIGRYVGPPVIWQWTLISSDIGALSQESVVDTGNAHLFISRDDFWIFDGSRPRSIGAPIREWFFTNSDSSYRYKAKAYYDKFKNIVWWFYAPNGSAGALTDAVVYNINNGKWGYAQTTIQTVLDYYSGQTTWDNWPSGTATDYDNIADVAFDSPYWDNDQSALAVFDSTNKLATLTGPCVTASLTTGDIGDETQYSTLTAVKPRFIARPTTTSLTNYTKRYSGDTATAGSTIAINGNKYDVLAAARYHTLKLSMSGDFEIVGIEADLSPDGDE